jgi:ABC-type Fe3+/spermidine/putrescine transport system ATPase subunit
VATSADGAHLQVQGLSVRLGDFALADVDLECDPGEHRILIGPTGSGKSTLLRCLLGLRRIDRGRILLDGRDLTSVPPERRGIGYVPQSYALFPHLDVEQNIRFGIQARRPPAREAAALLEELCDLLGIQALRQRRVRTLSGGEQQKVALGRALGTRPRLILLDEPFSSIDEGSRRHLWFELEHVIAERGVTAVHITHNLDEAHVMGQRLTVLIDGQVAQEGSPQEIQERPAGASVARFLGYRNTFRGTAEPVAGGTRVDLGRLAITVEEPIPAGEVVGICVRPQDIKILKEDVPVQPALARNVLAGRLTRLFPQPEVCTAWFALTDSGAACDLELRFPRYLIQRHALSEGKQVRVALWEPAIILWREGS